MMGPGEKKKLSGTAESAGLGTGSKNRERVGLDGGSMCLSNDDTVQLLSEGSGPLKLSSAQMG